MAGMKIKKGDQVIVRSGKDKGKVGTVTSASPKDNTVTVEGINVAKRHTKPRRAGETGEIKDVPQPLHVSNVGVLGPNRGGPEQGAAQEESNERRGHRRHRSRATITGSLSRAKTVGLAGDEMESKLAIRQHGGQPPAHRRGEHPGQA